jgi:hypothetical protein
MVSMSWLGDSTLAPGESYLIFGLRAGTAVELQHFMPVKEDLAQRAIQLFSAAMPQPGYVTVFGLAEVGAHPHRQPFAPLTGLRIRLRSGEFAKDLFTQDNGTFSAAGIPPGRIELSPFLPEGLKVFDIKNLTYTASANECVLLEIFVVSSGSGR